MDTEQERLSTREAAEILQVKEETLRRWRSNHTGPAYYRLSNPRRIYYLRKDLETYLQGERVEP